MSSSELSSPVGSVSGCAPSDRDLLESPRIGIVQDAQDKRRVRPLRTIRKQSSSQVVSSKKRKRENTPDDGNASDHADIAPRTYNKITAPIAWSGYEQSVLYSLIRTSLRAMNGDPDLIDTINWERIAFNFNIVCEGKILPMGPTLAESSRGKWQGHSVYGVTKSVRVMPRRDARSIVTFVCRQEGKAYIDVLTDWLKNMSEDDLLVGQAVDNAIASDVKTLSTKNKQDDTRKLKTAVSSIRWESASDEAISRFRKDTEEMTVQLQADGDFVDLISKRSKSRIANEIAQLKEKMASKAVGTSLKNNLKKLDS